MGGNKILEMTSGDYLDKTGRKEKKLSFCCQGIMRALQALVVTEKLLLLLGRKKATKLPSNPAPPNLFYLLPKEVWISCSTEFPNMPSSLLLRES